MDTDTGQYISACLFYMNVLIASQEVFHSQWYSVTLHHDSATRGDLATPLRRIHKPFDAFIVNGVGCSCVSFKFEVSTMSLIKKGVLITNSVFLNG
jgi:hypothetical protein